MSDQSAQIHRQWHRVHWSELANIYLHTNTHLSKHLSKHIELIHARDVEFWMRMRIYKRDRSQAASGETQGSPTMFKSSLASIYIHISSSHYK